MTVFQLDPDTGFSKVSKDPLKHFSFKVPTLRNVELTAPYMHNGVYKTLDQVVNFYNHGAGNKFRKDYGNERKGLFIFVVLPDSLDLNEQDKKDIVLFLKTLTDTTAIKNVPKRLPELKGNYADLNRRKIGGEY
jgi:cytochrome c peroxidase